MKNFTKYLLLAGLLLIASCNNSAKKKDSANQSNALKSENLHPLRNGFSIFALGSNIKGYSKSVKLIEEGFHKASYAVTDSNLLNINEGLKVDAITVRTWDDHIDFISVEVSDPYREKFIDLLIDAYGIDNNKPGDTIYTWFFRDYPQLLVTYNLDGYPSSHKASATFMRRIAKSEPNEKLIDEAKSNVGDI